MLRLPKFRYLSPRSVEEACSFLKERTGKIKIMAGGTDLLPLMKQRLFAPQYVLDLNQVSGLNNIEDASDREVRIGSLCTMSMLEESPVIKKYFPALSEAAGLVAAPQIRNMGTIGGNIALETRCRHFNQSKFWRKSIAQCIKAEGEVCHAVKGSKSCRAYFAADTVPLLIVLKARIILKDSEGERQCLLRDIYTQDGRVPNRLKPDDVITHVILPLPEIGSGSAYKKLRHREAISFPLAGVAVHVVMDGDICKDVKVALGAVGSGPIEVAEAENLLKGKQITEGMVEKLGNLAQKASHPVSNGSSTPLYRRRMVGVFTKSAFKEAISRSIP
jgi:4-hydroxybenzoyl-CoA reductase subunit beta